MTSILNYSLLFNMEKLSGSIYWNSIIMGSFRYVCNLTIAFCDRRFDWLGRKLVHLISNSFSAIALLVCTLVYLFSKFFPVCTKIKFFYFRCTNST